MKFFVFFNLIFFLHSNSFSVEPDEMLKNPNSERIAREIGKKIRCLVCQNEDIENSISQNLI